MQQEGWHYELESPDAPLVYKGVVFNEMKGAYSNPDDLLGDRARQSLFPDTTYSGRFRRRPTPYPGTDLPAVQVVSRSFLPSSNARIFFYGDDDPSERLRRMDEYLCEFTASPVNSAIPLQPRFDQPRRVVERFDPGDDPNSDKGRLVMNWLQAETSDPELLLGLSILSHILLGTPASPLRKALIELSLGEDLAGGGLETELRQVYFSHRSKRPVRKGGSQPGTGRKSGKPDLTDAWELAQDGIDPETIAASMNTVEFQLRENNTGAFPRGLLLMLRALNTWLYDGDPFAMLAFEAPLAAIKDGWGPASDILST